MHFLGLSFSFAILFCVILSLVDGRAITRYQGGRFGSSDVTGDVLSGNSRAPYGSRTKPEIRLHSAHGQHRELRYRGGRGGRHHHQHHDATDPNFENHLMRELRRYLSGTTGRNHHTFVHGVNRYGNQGGVL
ncbi:hypothetical protein LOTGIDRAFT_160670 [Lottia gigantea]|uniref:Secreted protein n=1 Tax=Lottia gigantea TaxID=225164 RepID=V4AL72_LOTGI|nr:hypothetical protein LOTGIDRAFT_160670 [Lottia gigantea]ESO95510.1 hypothetical protein LOTGIDRAFT_160670 [Lottia gigantea]